MDKIEKALQKLTAKERDTIQEILHCLETNDMRHLDIKKLGGYSDIFRVQKGSLRIVYRKDSKGQILLLTIERRDQNTYRDF